MNDVRKMIFGAILGLFMIVGLMISVAYVSSCGLTFTCRQAAPKVERTPIPTLIPVLQSETDMEEVSMAEFNKCEVSASDLIGAWVSAGASETETFPFTDVKGQSCQGTYTEDIQHLFVENSLWYSSSLGCVSCHNADLTERSGGLDLTTYDAVLLGSRRVAGSSSKGNDILGGGDWETSLLHEVLVNQGLAPSGHSADVPVSNPVLFAGSQAEEEATPTP